MDAPRPSRRYVHLTPAQRDRLFEVRRHAAPPTDDETFVFEGRPVDQDEYFELVAARRKREHGHAR